MVGIDAEMNMGRTKASDCGNDVCLEPCVCENGITTPQLEEFEVDVVGVKGADVCPFTPNPRRENGDSVVVVGSPLSSESPKSSNVEGLACTSSDEVVGSRLDDSPRTPEEGVFNPFAPGPEEMCLAPLCKRLVKESMRIVARRLDFDADDCDEMMEEDKEVDALIEQELLDTVYGMLLEAIIVKQTEEFLAENDPLNLEGCRTPTSPPPLNGIAETCPKAPVKASARKSLNIDPGLCKKLEF